MKKEVIQVVSRENGELSSKQVKAAPYEFTIATRAKWEMVISDEDTEIRAGEFKKVNVKEILLDPDMVALPCTFTHHAVVSLVKVGAKGGAKPVDSERIINSAYVLGQESGKVREGDLLAVLNIFPIMFTREAMTPKSLR
ncbi:DUF22 domain-containing protein [uncultured Methanolobus sp.]|jgi:Uncharacterized conserved protein|uniref:DUF22 domain-containing protein n=1 Tax=uncultured Methanolobus sp. TaxID=218300 RepID=UPI0029C91D0F|nr:DUF22 domain-containing protein [uncultured Methanolobus sp.]